MIRIISRTFIIYMVVLVILCNLFGEQMKIETVEGRYLPTRSQTDGLDRLRELLRDILDTDNVQSGSVGAALQQHQQSQTHQQQQLQQQQQQQQQQQPQRQSDQSLQSFPNGLDALGLNLGASVTGPSSAQPLRYDERLPIRNLEDLEAALAQRRLMQQQQQLRQQFQEPGLVNPRFIFKRNAKNDNAAGKSMKQQSPAIKLN